MEDNRQISSCRKIPNNLLDTLLLMRWNVTLCFLQMEVISFLRILYGKSGGGGGAEE